MPSREKEKNDTFVTIPFAGHRRSVGRSATCLKTTIGCRRLDVDDGYRYCGAVNVATFTIGSKL